MTYIKNIQAFLNPFYIVILFSFISLLWLIFILIFFYKIYNFLFVKNNKNTNFEFESILNNKEFLIFKNNLFNLYYLITIIFIAYCLNLYGYSLIISLTLNNPLMFIYYFLILARNLYDLYLYTI